MLEQPALLLRPWELFPGSSARAGLPAADIDRTRAILDATGTPLGVAGWSRRGGPRWWRWLRGPALEIYETEDESLLFRMHRVWVPTPRWQVRDADARPVGSLRPFQGIWSASVGAESATRGSRLSRCRGTWIEDRWGRTFTLMRHAADPSQGRWLTPDGYELGRLSRCSRDQIVAFAAELEGEPFVKMLLLASALVIGEW